MSRQRNVFPTDEIPHLWAHQTQQSARNQGGNLFYANGIIFSYGHHFPIAKHVESVAGKAVFFTTRSCSVTTSKHLSMVRSAIPGNLPVFRVYDVTADYRTQAQDFAKSVKTAEKALSDSKSKPQKALRYRALQAAISDSNEYNTWAGYKNRFALPANAAEMEANAIEYESQLEARRVAKWAREQETREARRKADLLDAESWANRQPELIEAWRNGENPPELTYWRLSNLPVMLRVKGDEIETSKGVRFPVEHGKLGIRIVERVIKTGEPFQRNGRAIHLGHYEIDRIDTDGTVHAGCHVVSYSEVQRIARILGVTV